MIALDLPLIDRYAARYRHREYRADIRGEMIVALLSGTADTYRAAYNAAVREVYAFQKGDVDGELMDDYAYEPLPCPAISKQLREQDNHVTAELLETVPLAQMPQWLANVAVSRAYLSEIDAEEYAPEMDGVADVYALTYADWRAVLSNLVERGVIRSRNTAESLACELAEMPTLARALLSSYTRKELNGAGYSDIMVNQARDYLRGYVYRDDQL